MHKLVVDPAQYSLNALQIESLASEFYGKADIQIAANELEINFDNLTYKEMFEKIINEKFKKIA